MKYCISGRQPKSVLSQADEIKMQYRDRDRYYDTYTVADPDKNIIVLQMVICGDMEVIAECVYAKDYDINNAPEGGK